MHGITLHGANLPGKLCKTWSVGLMNFLLASLSIQMGRPKEDPPKLHRQWSCLCTHTAPRAEATALLLAIRWCCHLQIGFAYHAAKVEFAFDCQTVAGVAQGQFGSSHNSDLLLPIRALLHWLEVSTLEPFIWTHLRGHSDHPWNEAADTLCHHADVTVPLSMTCSCTSNNVHLMIRIWCLFSGFG